MNKYKVTGLYTISFEMEVEAESREEAEQMGYDVDIQTEWNGNSVFVLDRNIDLNADGMPFDVEVELLESEEEEEANTNVWYAIADCEEPEDYRTDFYKWDTKYDVCYELDVYDELMPDADKCHTLTEAEDRAKDVLSGCWADKVYIVLVHEDEDGDIDYTEFIKIVNRNFEEEN